MPSGELRSSHSRVSKVIVEQLRRQMSSMACLTSSLDHRSCRCGDHCRYCPRSSATCCESRDVTGIATVHHPLRQVDTSPGDIGASSQVGHLAHRPAVNSHPYGNLRVLLERLSNLKRTLCRFLRGLFRKTSAIPSPVGSRTSSSFGASRTWRSPARFRSVTQPLVLLFDQEFGITDQVDKEHVPDLEP